MRWSYQFFETKTIRATGSEPEVCFSSHTISHPLQNEINLHQWNCSRSWQLPAPVLPPNYQHCSWREHKIGWSQTPWILGSWSMRSGSSIPSNRAILRQFIPFIQNIDLLILRLITRSILTIGRKFRWSSCLYSRFPFQKMDDLLGIFDPVLFYRKIPSRSLNIP